MHEMTQGEYKGRWRPVQQQVFHLGRRPPDQVFRRDFRLAFYEFPGIHFNENFYSTLQEVLSDLGEERFAVVGNPHSAPKEEFRFVYPSDLTWSEFTEGKGIQHFHLNYSDEYYIFGERGDWGMYSFTVEFGLIIIGYRQPLAGVFEDRFVRERDEVARWASGTLELTEGDFESRFAESYLSRDMKAKH